MAGAVVPCRGASAPSSRGTCVGVRIAPGGVGLLPLAVMVPHVAVRVDVEVAYEQVTD
jgi:hypothetical protein